MPYASLYGAAYEFALNLAMTLNEYKLRDQVELTFVTPEPFLGHFGHEGLGNSHSVLESAFSRLGIRWLTEAHVIQVEDDGLVLAGNVWLPSRFTMLIPAYRGIKPVQAVTGLADEAGQIPVDPYYRSPRYLNIFAAGVAMQVKSAKSHIFPCGVFTPGVMSAEMGRAAAINLAADLGYGYPIPRSADGLEEFLYVLDMGSQGLFISFGSHSWLNLQTRLPGPWSHWAKIIAEKYQMYQLQAGKF
jgi:sulfide:quinone oxidoreductase